MIDLILSLLYIFFTLFFAFVFISYNSKAIVEKLIFVCVCVKLLFVIIRRM